MKINSSSGNEVGTYCGQKTGTTVLVAGKYVEIVFHSDQSKEKGGFLLQFAVFSNGKYNHNVLPGQEDDPFLLLANRVAQKIIEVTM